MARKKVVNPLRRVLSYPEKLIVSRELAPVCRSRFENNKKFSEYDTGWTDVRMTEHMQPFLPGVTVHNIATIRRDTLGPLYERIDSPGYTEGEGKRPSGQAYNRIRALEETVAKLLAWAKALEPTANWD